MYSSLIILEFNHLSMGYSIIDRLLKNYDIDLVKVCRICPGKLLVIASGLVEDIQEIKDQLKKRKEILISVILGVHPECIKLLSSHTAPEPAAALAVIEMNHALHAIEVTNYILQNFPIHINKLNIALGLFGKGVVICTGQLADMLNIQEYLTTSYSKPTLINFEIISHPHTELLNIL